MAEQLYDKFADISALEKERDIILQQIFGPVKAEIIALSKQTINLNTGNGSGKKDVDELSKQTQKLNALQGDYAKQLAAVKLQQAEVNKQNKEAAKEALGMVDAYAKLSKEYEKSARAAQNLIVTKGKDSEETKKAIAKAQELGQKLKDTDADVLKFQRNVGNYANSLASGFDKVADEIAKLKAEQKGLQDLTKNQRVQISGFHSRGGDQNLNQAEANSLNTLNASLKETEEQYNKVTASLQQLEQVQAVGFKQTGNATQQVRQLENAYIQLAQSGTQSTEFLNQFKNAIGSAKDDVQDLKESIKLAASDTRGLDILIGGAQAVAGGFGVAQGAAALFGNENEDLQRTLVKLNGIMTILNGLQAIQAELKKKDNILTTGQIALQKLYAIVVGTSTGAMKAFKLALAATGVGLLIIGLTELVSWLAKTSDNTEALIKDLDNLKAANEGVRNSIDRNVKEDIQNSKERGEASSKQLKIELDGLKEKRVLLNEEYQLAKKNVDEKTKDGLVDADLLAKRNEAQKALLDNMTERKILASEIRIAEKEEAQESIKNAKAKADSLKKLSESELDLLKEIALTEGFSDSKRLNALQLFMEKRTAIIRNGIKEDEKLSEEQILRLQQLTNETGSIFDKIFKWENNEKVIADVQEVAEVTSEELLAMSEDSDETLKALGEKVLDGVKKTSEVLKAEAKKQSLELEDIYTDTFQTIVDGAGNILSGLFDSEKNRVQDQLDDIDKLKAAEIDRINTTADSEEKKAAKIKIVEAKAQSDREALQRKQRQISIQQAIAERALKAFQIIIDGQQAAARLQAQVNLLKALVAAPPPIGGPQFAPGLALAQASLLQQRITTIVSLATVLATPIPKFAKGKTAADPYEGFGIVGEAGREIGFDRKGNVRMFDKPTLTYLSKGTTILPNKVTEDMMRAANSEQAGMIKAFSNNISVSAPDNRDILEKTLSELKQINKKPPMIIHNERGIESSAWYQQHMKH